MFRLVHKWRHHDIPSRTTSTRGLGLSWFSSSLLQSNNPPLVQLNDGIKLPVLGSFLSSPPSETIHQCWIGTKVNDETSISHAVDLLMQNNVLVYEGRNYGRGVQFVAAAKRHMNQQLEDTKESSEERTVTQEWKIYRHQQRQEANMLNRILVQAAAIPNDNQHSLILSNPNNLETPRNLEWALQEATMSHRQLYHHEDEESLSHFLVPLRELGAHVAADQWGHKGIPISIPNNEPNKANGVPLLLFHIHPQFGVYPPTRQEYLPLVWNAPLPSFGSDRNQRMVMDVGTGTGLLAALFLKRPETRVWRGMLTDVNPLAVVCARDNMERLELASRVHVELTQDLFPNSNNYNTPADVILCNPPWIPDDDDAKTSWLDRAIFDDAKSNVLYRFLRKAPDHLRDQQSQVWLILSDLAEHLRLRSREELLQVIHDSGLQVIDIQSTVPTQDQNWNEKASRRKAKTNKKKPKRQEAFPKVAAARQAEQTHLFRLCRRET